MQQVKIRIQEITGALASSSSRGSHGPDSAVDKARAKLGIHNKSAEQVHARDVSSYCVCFTVFRIWQHLMRSCSSEKPLRVVIAVVLAAATPRGTGMDIGEMVTGTGIEKGSGTKTSIVKETATEQGRAKGMKIDPEPKSSTSTSTGTSTVIATALLHLHPQVHGLLVPSKMKAFEVS